MTVSELKEMRNKLNEAIAREIHIFESSTGFSVREIQVDRAHWKIGNVESDSLLGVKARIELPEGI
jgi:hypothetical protein